MHKNNWKGGPTRPASSGSQQIIREPSLAQRIAFALQQGAHPGNRSESNATLNEIERIRKARGRVTLRHFSWEAPGSHTYRSL